MKNETISFRDDFRQNGNFNMQNPFPESTNYTYREKETDSRVFLMACTELASQLIPKRDKMFNFH